MSNKAKNKTASRAIAASLLISGALTGVSQGMEKENVPEERRNDVVLYDQPENEEREEGIPGLFYLESARESGQINESQYNLFTLFLMQATQHQQEIDHLNNLIRAQQNQITTLIAALQTETQTRVAHNIMQTNALNNGLQAQTLALQTEIQTRLAQDSAQTLALNNGLQAQTIALQNETQALLGVKVDLELQKINLAQGLEYQKKFSGSLITSLDLSNGISFDWKTLNYCEYLTSLNLTNATHTILDWNFYKCTNLKELNLTKNTGVDGRYLSELKKLNILDLTDNNTCKGESIRNLTPLTSLNLTRNTKIGDYDIQDLKNLTNLNLTNNTTLTYLYSSTQERLLILDLTENSSVSDNQLKDMTRLTSLNLTNNHKITGDSFKYLTNLTWLNLTQNTGVKDKKLACFGKLAFLDLTKNERITGSCITHLANLKSLNLTNNITFKDCHVLSLKKVCPNLEVIGRTVFEIDTPKGWLWS